jgi:hypothetical protein
MERTLLLSLSLVLICFVILFSFPVALIAKDLDTEVLVIGGSQSGVAAAIQAARQGSKVVLISKSDWLGGSMVEAGVSATDGNELLAFHTGLWGEFLTRLAKKEPNLLQYGWVSLFAFNPQIGKSIMEEWVRSEPNITWIRFAEAKEVLFDESGKFKKVIGVKLIDGREIKAKVTIDATELGDLLEIGNISSRLGWEFEGEFNEPSAPKKKSKLIVRYPYQELTWAFYMKDFGEGKKGPEIPAPVGYTYKKASERYWCAFKNEKLSKKKSAFFDLEPSWNYRYNEAEQNTQFFSTNDFLTYGQISPNLFMINWPKCGNDYSLGIERVFSKNPEERERFYKEARTQSLWFARYVQDTLGRRFSMADEVFPRSKENDGIGGVALIPYNRDTRRLEGFKTLTEKEILPNIAAGEKARYLPDSIAIGNYANDHHYFEMADPGSEKHFKAMPKSIRWGGRYSGTPFSIPYSALIPVETDGLIVAEKSWSVSHLANGATRLQPVCILVGQAAGAAAALAVQKNIQPFDLKVNELQAILLNDSKAPTTVIPLFDILPDNKYRAAIQRLILSKAISFPLDGQFWPDEQISKEDFHLWASKAGLSENQITYKPMSRAEAAYLIESMSNTLGAVPVSENSSQALAKLGVKDYCADLKTSADLESFKLENLETSEGKPVMRNTPFASNQARTAGAITIDPRVYNFLRDNKASSLRICFKGAYNHSGAWMLITQINPSIK